MQARPAKVSCPSVGCVAPFKHTQTSFLLSKYHVIVSQIIIQFKCGKAFQVIILLFYYMTWQVNLRPKDRVLPALVPTGLFGNNPHILQGFISRQVVKVAEVPTRWEDVVFARSVSIAEVKPKQIIAASASKSALLYTFYALFHYAGNNFQGFINRLIQGCARLCEMTLYVIW